MVRSIIFAVCLFMVSVVHAQQAAGPVVSFGIVRKSIPEKGQLILVRQQHVTEYVQVVKRVNVNGKLVDVTETVARLVPIETDTVYSIGESRVITADGKQLPIEEVWKRLEKNTVVAISGDFDTPSPAFLRALAPRTLVLIPAQPKSGPAPK